MRSDDYPGTTVWTCTCDWCKQQRRIYYTTLLGMWLFLALVFAGLFILFL